MSNSSLVNVTVKAHSSNYSKGRSQKISKITIHHMAGKLTALQCGRIFQTKNRKASAHYGVGSDGKIGLYVDESNTAYSDGNWSSNCKSVSIETANSSTGGSWPVSDKTLKLLIKLVADIAKRNNLGKLVVGKNLTYHSMYASTTCPGNHLRSKMQYIADEANKINSGKTTAKTETTKKTETAKEMYRVRKSWSDSKSQIGAFTSLDNAKSMAIKNPGYKVYNSAGKCVYSPTTGSNTSFKVEVKISDLHIRKGAGTGYASKGFIKPGVYTIVETKVSGGYTWGKLKSGAGWIALKYTERL